MLSRLCKPHYIYRPSQLVRRALLPRHMPELLVETPWGCRMLIARSDKIGAGIARMGVHELAVSETIWRLSEADDLALDVGANLGYFSGLFACKAREVLAIEPNPLLRPFIGSNIERWDVGEKITLDSRAASNRTGTAILHLPSDHTQNFGIATLGASDGTESYEVETFCLDDLIAGRHVGLLKIDVEGHEMAALEGASESLANGLIRDIIFEDHQPLPSPVSRMLVSAGFALRGIEETLTRPLLVSDRTPRGWDAPTYLATRDQERTTRLMRPRGWGCLRGRR
jgi:FkbM family methyltransferase